MELRTYLELLPDVEKEAFALRVGATIGHLRNIGYGGRKASAALAAQIEIDTGGRVSVSDLRPKDWHLIWDPRRNHLVHQRAIVEQNDVASVGEVRPHLLANDVPAG